MLWLDQGISSSPGMWKMEDLNLLWMSVLRLPSWLMRSFAVTKADDWLTPLKYGLITHYIRSRLTAPKTPVLKIKAEDLHSTDVGGCNFPDVLCAVCS